MPIRQLVFLCPFLETKERVYLVNMISPIVTIIGNGFGGVYTARALLKHGVRVRLIGTEDYFTFMPLLHEVATGTLCDSDVRFPIRSFLTNNNKLEIISSQAAVIDFEAKRITLKNDSVLEYEYLVIATGARPRFDLLQGSEHAFCLKTMNDARQIREAIIRSSRSGKDHIEINVIGGGFTGLELACELDQLLDKKIKLPSKLRMFERGGLPFAESDPKLSAYIAKRLERSGIEFHSGSVINQVTKNSVHANGQEFHSDITLLTAGVQPNTDCVDKNYLDTQGNLLVSRELNIPKHPEVFALGDIISIIGATKPPMLAQLAVQQASLVARNICHAVHKKPLQPYTVKVMGILVSLGTWDAAGRVFGILISGRIAWYIWRTVYLFKTPGLSNQLRIALRWTEYLFKKRTYIP